MEEDKIKLKIDGQDVTARQGMTVLEAADKAGIYIPKLCNHPDLVPFGACRLCITKIEGLKGLPCACTTPATNDLVVTTTDDQLSELRKEILSLILEEHPHACLACAQKEGCTREPCSTNVPVDERCCPKFGSCELQKVVEYVGFREDTPKYVPKEKRVVEDEPLFIRNYGLCILCGRCVRACRELRKVGTLGFLGRSYEVEIGTAYNRSFADTGCRFCGACVEVCPTGALLDKDLPSGPKENVLVPCRSSCPAGVDVPRFLHLLADKNYADAQKVIREALPLPGTIGTLCEHPCEEDCRRGKVNEPIAIADLHVFSGFQDDDSWKSKLNNNKNGKKIAVVGSGLAGLSGAYFLRLKGYDITVFEKEDEPGGRLRTSESSSELTKACLKRELDDLMNLGIEIQISSNIEDPKQLLEKGYDAVLLAIGPSPSPNMEPSEADKIFSAGDMTSTTNLGIPEKVAEGRNAAATIDQSLVGGGEVIPVLLEPEEPIPCIGRIDGFAFLERKDAKSSSGEAQKKTSLTEEDAVYEAARCLHCNLRLFISEVSLPPEEWLTLTAENVEKVPECEGVYILLDEEKNTLKIKGTMNLHSDITAELDSNARFFKFEEDRMYSQRESELLQLHLQKYGEMPGGGEDELDDLF
ncbi:MAG: (2Fe-2S)-binding protein [Thermoplasmata archaeon]|nr:MAG: (2Fe-2S)-binding protein [Thermoplasmata archaeon]